MQQWHYMRLWEDGKLSCGMETGLDLGCQKMRNYPIFRTEKYIGVDHIDEYLERGQKERPKATPIHAKIEDFDAYPNADFALCVQVFQLVKQFDVPNTVPILEGVVNKINPGGALLINFGRHNMEFIDDIRHVLQSGFNDVTEFNYPLANRTPTPLFYLLAAKAFYGKPETDVSGKKYFRCVGRKD